MSGWQLPPEVSQDPILGEARLYAEDARAHKMDLLAGVLKKEGKIWLFESVRKAQGELIEAQAHKGYLPIEGSRLFLELLSKQMGVELTSWGALQALGATGALSLASSLLKTMGGKKILLSHPSWPNHRRIFESSGLEVGTFSYPLEDPGVLKSKIQREKAPVTLLWQACCHNPTGIDLEGEALKELFQEVAKGGHSLLIDMAYQGLKEGMLEDAYSVRLALELGVDVMVAYSCAKNFTLYGERAGALFVRFKQSSLQARMLAYLTHLARARYSNPPLHGAAVVSHLLQQPSLLALWEQELVQARKLLTDQREKVALGFAKAGFSEIAASIRSQCGMFAYFTLEKEAIEWLKGHEAIYLPKEGRINLTSLSEDQIPRVCQALSVAFSREF